MDDFSERGAGHDAWRRAGPYEFVHPSGWTITNRIVRRRPVWTLQRGYRSEGGFLLPSDAMERHDQLIGDMLHAKGSNISASSARGNALPNWLRATITVF